MSSAEEERVIEHPPTLRGKRVTLRPLAEDDLPALLRIVTEPGVREWWVGYDAESLRRDMFDGPETTPFAIELGGELVGAIMATEELDPHYKHASIDVTVDARHLGQGLGTDALRTLIRYLIDQRGHHRVTIDPAAANERAVAAYPCPAPAAGHSGSRLQHADACMICAR